jgi:uncharacterized membrane protein YccC
MSDFCDEVKAAVAASRNACDATKNIMKQLLDDEPDDALALGDVWRKQSDAHRALKEALNNMALETGEEP